MYQWTVTIPTVRTVATQVVRGSHTWVVCADGQQQARDLVLAAAVTDKAVRRWRGALLDTAGIDVAPWRSGDFREPAC
ncbi:hypothetical protein [Streptomyces sp. NPDC001250]|uniref:hypothetical protein n=1 Tax=unclassified Streptomyces TaxID=2593676 RepID=UPI00331FF9E3